MTLQAQVTGQDEVSKALVDLVAATRKRLGTELRRRAVATRSKAKKRVPQASKTLYRSITETVPRKTGDKLEAVVFSRAAYAPFVEGIYHNYTMGRAPGKMPPPAPIEAWLKAKGLPPEMLFPVRRKIGKKGTKAQPFMKPAADIERPKFFEECEKIFKIAANEVGFLMGRT